MQMTTRVSPLLLRSRVPDAGSECETRLEENEAAPGAKGPAQLVTVLRRVYEVELLEMVRRQSQEPQSHPSEQQREWHDEDATDDGVQLQRRGSHREIRCRRPCSWCGG